MESSGMSDSIGNGFTAGKRPESLSNHGVCIATMNDRMAHLTINPGQGFMQKKCRLIYNQTLTLGLVPNLGAGQCTP
jgi:hypothetical protein